MNSIRATYTDPADPRPQTPTLRWVLPALLTATLAGCSKNSTTAATQSQPILPNFAAATFSNAAALTHSLFSFPPSTSTVYALEGSAEPETIIVERLPGTRTVMGLACAIVRDHVYEDGLLIEDTYDWYAQDDAGNVWYMGEAVLNYVYDANGVLIDTTTDGSWEAGLDIANTGAIAQPGYAMPANPRVGDHYYQEFYPGIAQDIGRVIAVNRPVTLADGRQVLCVLTEDTSAFAPGLERKFYAPGIGFVLEEKPGETATLQQRGRFETQPSSLPVFAQATFTAPAVLDHPLMASVQGITRLYTAVDPDEVETMVVERLPGTRTVMGIPCAIIRDRVFLDGHIKEDTRDWYAQDDDGNVWYMGEEVDNYVYDEQGNLSSINHNGSWEAGLDIAGVGSVALPGHHLPAQPVVGRSFYQEFYVGEAEDMGLTVADGALVTLDSGLAFNDCLQVLDWNPLDPDGLEYKFYAPQLGLVREAALHDLTETQVVGVFDQRPASIPNFAAASFTQSTLIDNDLFPLPPGATWEYESETEDGLELTTIEVLAATRVVAGKTCVAVRARAYLDAVIIEDTEDWYAQDDTGNVWYMGEDVLNYRYDENGNLLSTDNAGSWEAGLDIAGTGAPARPGIQMPANPLLGVSYYQEYYATEAEDMAQIIGTDVTVTLSTGEVFQHCVHTVDWNPLEPDAIEAKFYAPGLGLVLERHLVHGEVTELSDTNL